jgi:Icc-related predicted phosphoesterase
MRQCFFVSDIHGHVDRYRKLFAKIEKSRPAAVFIGGDIMPHGIYRASNDAAGDFVSDYLASEFRKLREKLGEEYPRVFLILGNDDGRDVEIDAESVAEAGLWEYVHNRRASCEGHAVYGYSYVPPTPFMLKDWEKYDVSRHVDPGCVSPEEGFRTVDVSADEARYSTILKDLEKLLGNDDTSSAVLLCHTPPYDTNLDRAALDGRMVDHAPVDVHVGSIAVRRMIENKQPLLALHGHIHESARITGSWRDRIGGTILFTAAHDGPHLAIVRFSLENPEDAVRDLI